MKLTYLQIINIVLSALDSQSVETASGSVESEQVGLIVNRVYNEICSRRTWPWLREVGFSKVSLTSKAWELDLPDTCMTLEYITYNKKELTYLTPKEMAYKLQGRTPNTTNINLLGIKYDSDPTYWTSYDDATITFDSYDGTYANLLPAKCYIQFIKETPNELSGNADIPIIHPRYHSVLLYGVLGYAFLELAQDTGKGDRYLAEYKRGVARMVRWARRIEETETKLNQPDYGRRGR